MFRFQQKIKRLQRNSKAWSIWGKKQSRETVSVPRCWISQQNQNNKEASKNMFKELKEAMLKKNLKKKLTRNQQIETLKTEIIKKKE